MQLLNRRGIKIKKTSVLSFFTFVQEQKRAVLVGSLTLLPATRVPFPIKSLALSAHVSPRTIHFRVLDKSPVSGPGRGPPSCNKWRLWWGLFFAETDILTTRGTQGPACLPMDQTQQPQLGPFCPCLLLTWTTGQSAPTSKEQETLLTSPLPSLFPLLSPSYPSLFF